MIGPGLTIVTGHYGTGKSEFSVSFAVALREAGDEVIVVDLDIVNPYFRSREARSLLEPLGISVVGNSLEIDRGVDLPAISPAAVGSLAARERRVIVDLGGDPVGARVMRRFGRAAIPENYQMLYVLNVYRPENRTLEATIDSIRGIEDASGLKVTALVNNSHLLESTGCENLLAGDKRCRQLESELGLPTRYCSGRPELLDACGEELLGERIRIGMYLRQEWMSSTAPAK
ncbi:MAG: hypothetical protein ACLFP6_01125 [Spirochaetaceae bacterium]